MTEQSTAEAIFFAALEKPTPEDRAAFLDAECNGDGDLRRRVERLLHAHPQVGSFLEPAQPAPQTASYQGPAEAVGCVIAGRYKLVEEIGEGGMGTVFMAQQTEPVKRLVAVKVIKPGMDSKQVLARFEAERQALALMDHPNIAKVFDGGITEQGRPYFVMELVKGVPITRFCDERKLTPAERLELLVPVCQAIQHAHQKGIIHRDIKPSNVLVALYDGRPVPKVIDFGVAKAAGQQLTEATLVTGFGTVIGTPEYMSPEQAELNQLDIDTRSDVYALGVLLYELLTGTTPIDRKRLGKAAVLEILRVVREEEPPRPSTRLSTSDALPTIAAARRMEPVKLTHLVRGELDWIVMKCLDKERTRRYETAGGLAQDIQRFLADEAVEACPPSATYRLRKFLRRNKGRVLTAAAVLIALLGGTVAATWQAAERKREQAERRLEQEGVAARSRQGAQVQLERAEAALKNHKLTEADAAVRQADLFLADTDAPELRERLASGKKDLAMVRQLDDIFAWRWNLVRGQVRLFPNKARELYPPALREYGLAIGQQPAETTVEAIRRSTIADALRVALVQWFFLEPAQPGLRAVLDADDPDAIRVDIRAAVAAGQQERVRQLVEKADPDRFSPEMATALGMYLPPEQSLRLMKAAWHRRPDSFPLAITIAARLTEMDLLQGNAIEAAGWCRIAVAIRPDSAFAHHCLGVALGEAGDMEGRFAELREAMRLAPRYQRAGALYVYSLLIHVNPVRPATDEEVEKAFAMCQNMLRVNPKHPNAHAGLYMIHVRRKNWIEAARHHRSFCDFQKSAKSDDWEQYSCPEVAFMVVFGPGWRFDEVLDGLVKEGRPDEAFRFCEQCLTPWDSELLSKDLTGHASFYAGACAGIQWCEGAGGSAPPPAQPEAVRRTARQWLSVVLSGWTNAVAADRAKQREIAHATMLHWLADADLASVRDDAPLARLPDEERKEWQKLWSDVRSLRDRTAPEKLAPADK
jgi:eukaryotic-like serine/threonine-protein kinase